MKILKITLPLILTGIVALGFKPDRGIRDLIEWNESAKVKWDDYKGGITDTIKIASSNCGIYCIPQVLGDSASITLIAYFDRNKSWVSKHHADSFFLKHEQGHFDLTEAYARKLRKKISTIRPARENFSAEIKKFYNWAWEDLQKQQAAYDKATDEGAVDFAQKVWDTHIQNLLLQNKDYASSTVKIGIVN
ncbi:MAG: DUF922 domain-containing protein [Bacteroidia bacterium]